MLQLDSSSPQSAINNSHNNTPRQQANSTKPPTTTNHKTKKTRPIKTDRCKTNCTNKHESISSFVRDETADKWYRNSPDASNPSNANAATVVLHWGKTTTANDHTRRSSLCCPPPSTTECVLLIQSSSNELSVSFRLLRSLSSMNTGFTASY